MSAVLKIGPKGGKIVGYTGGGKPIYLDEAKDAGLHLIPEAGSPAESATAAGLAVSVHPTHHDHVQIRWKNENAKAAKAWFLAHPDMPKPKAASTTTLGGALVVDRAWASKANPAAAKKVKASKPKPKKAAKAVAAKKAAAPAKPGLAKAGFWKVDKSTMKSTTVKSFHYSASHAVIAGGKPGKLVGFEIGTDFYKTGKLVVEHDDGSLASYPPAAVTKAPGSKIQPGWHDNKVEVFASAKVTAVIDSMLNEKIAGMSTTFAAAFDALDSKGIPVFVVGGFVRDALHGDAVKDVDIATGAHHSDVIATAKSLGWPAKCNWHSGRMMIGDTGQELHLDAKSINGSNMHKGEVKSYGKPSAVGTDIAAEAEYRDFTVNALFYCPKNKAVIDPTGLGAIEDTLNKTLRPPVPESEWDSWIDRNPSVVVRAAKMMTKGYKPTPELVAFLKKRAAKAMTAIGAYEMQWQARNFTGGSMDWHAPKEKAKIEAAKDAFVELLGDDGKKLWNAHFAPIVGAKA